MAEVEAEYAAPSVNRQALSSDPGALLPLVVNLVRKEGLDPEAVLAAANAKFIRIFHAMEIALLANGESLETADLPTMESAWQAAKSEG